MDRATIERVAENLLATAERIGYPLDEVIVFGSRVREDYRDDSDVDVLIVSPDFEGMKAYKRSKLFFRDREYDELPDPKLICLTTEEFEERRTKQPHIVRTAVEERVSVAGD